MLLVTLTDDFTFGILIYKEQTFMQAFMTVEINGLTAYDTFKIIMN